MTVAVIDPVNVTNYNRSDDELQRFWLFGIVVASKDADWAARKVGDLLKGANGQLPFDYLREHEIDLHNILVANRVGQYARIRAAIEQSLDLDLRTATVEELCGVFGVGPKTARFFILHSRPNANVAVLDTHVLRWMREYHQCEVPVATPPEPAYSRIEGLALALMRDCYPGLSPAEADLLIWSTMSGRTELFA